MNSLNHTCEFCLEFQDFKNSRIGQIYSNKLSDRIVQGSENFLVIPTIGQIVAGSLLILPKIHYETFAEIPSDLISEAMDLIGSVVGNDNYLLWEHGAQKTSNSSCGVYHAHIHLIPIKKLIDPKTLVGENAYKCNSIQEALNKIRNENNYILLSLSRGSYYYSVYNLENQDRFKSQYFRKWLVAQFNNEKDWDWKNYNFIEQDLLNAVK